MKSPLAPNRFPHFFLNFPAVLESHRCHSQHRQSSFRANQAAPLPTFEKSADATPGTTNAFLRGETSWHIRLVPLDALNQAWIRGRVSRSSVAIGMTSLTVKATNNRV